MSVSDRRTVLRAAAWTPPVVMVAAAAPSAVASPAPTPQATATVVWAKQTATVTIINTGTVDIPAGQLSAQVESDATVTQSLSGWKTADGQTRAPDWMPFYSQLPLVVGATVQVVFKCVPSTLGGEARVWLGSTQIATSER